MLIADQRDYSQCQMDNFKTTYFEVELKFSPLGNEMGITWDLVFGIYIGKSIIDEAYDISNYPS